MILYVPPPREPSAALGNVALGANWHTAAISLGLLLLLWTQFLSGSARDARGRRVERREKLKDARAKYEEEVAGIKRRYPR